MKTSFGLSFPNNAQAGWECVADMPDPRDNPDAEGRRVRLHPNPVTGKVTIRNEGVESAVEAVVKAGVTVVETVTVEPGASAEVGVDKAVRDDLRVHITNTNDLTDIGGFMVYVDVEEDDG